MVLTVEDWVHNFVIMIHIYCTNRGGKETNPKEPKPLNLPESSGVAIWNRTTSENFDQTAKLVSLQCVLIFLLHLSFKRSFKPHLKFSINLSSIWQLFNFWPGVMVTLAFLKSRVGQVLFSSWCWT